MSDHIANAARRVLLQQASAFSVLGTGAPLAMSLAAAGAQAAAATSDYKALVCIFLYGGNDAYNTIVATDDESWRHYTAVRNQQPTSIALLRDKLPDKTAPIGSPEWLGGVLPIAARSKQAARSFAMHPLMTDAQRLFNINQRLAIVANVGPLTEPLSKADFTDALKQKPRKLFSHNDQQSTWQSLAPEGATVGWGGRFADLLSDANSNSMFTAISANGNCVWSSGRHTRTYQISPYGPVRLGPVNTQGKVVVFGSDEVGDALLRIVSSARSNQLMAADLADLSSRSIRSERILSKALPTTNGLSAENPLSQQLQQVARLIAAKDSLSMKRQVFFVGLGGFDTHHNQNKTHADLMAKLNHALAYFDNTLGAMGLSNQVTTFTCSDFGRSFTSNGDGSDHGWGGHHLVMGGAVRGGDIYGRFPTIGKKNRTDNEFDASPDQLNNGVLLPNISIDQYGATLGRWFGLSDGQLNDIFPNLARFAPSQNLGFMAS